MVKQQERTTAVAQSATVDVAQTVAKADRRKLIPELGMKEYWYPAIEDKKVKNKPIGLKFLGEQLVFFRGKDGQVAALWNVCPHRGGSLMHGDCHFEGTVSCPYHGWTYDGDGNVLAVLPEGPESKIPGKVMARKYPTQTLRGMVFVWMGDEEPAPIEEDVAPEFFHDNGIMLYAWEVWPINWRQANENAADAHVPYVHRDAALVLLGDNAGISGARGGSNVVVNDRAVKSMRVGASTPDGRMANARVPQAYFPGIDTKWPKRRLRMTWTWATKWGQKRRNATPVIETSDEWTAIHHLPAMVRLDYRSHVYTRVNVPIDETNTRQMYLHHAKANNWLGRLYEKLHFHLFHRWAMYSNFSVQDFRAAGPQRYDSTEYLSSTDAHLVVWRRLQTRARGLEHVQAAKVIPNTSAEAAAREVQIDLGMTPEWGPNGEEQ